MTAPSPIVTTPLGQLKGSTYFTNRGETIYTFQGVPYAKPPIGDLRFKAPVPPDSWDGVRSAEKAPTMASTLYVGPDGKYHLYPGSGEDCLYLNVYTPQLPDKGVKLPVMVFLHGGGFTNSTGNMGVCGPDYLCPMGVILVTINYRLGALGFVSLRTQELPGNNGLKDQNQGLRWIQGNIESFGGDPGNVTIFGQSAGAASVQYHQLSPLSRGLFHKAIALSGSVLNRWAYSRYPVESTTLLAKRLGSKSSDAKDVLDTLSKAAAEDICVQSVGLFQEIEGQWATEEIMCYPFVPTAEPVGTPNAFLTKSAAEAVQDGDLADVPYITGTLSDEEIFCLPSADYSPPADDDLLYQKMLPKELDITLGSAKAIAAAQKLKDFYFPNGPTQAGWINAVSTLSFGYGIAKTIQAYAKNPNKTSPNYLYLFNAWRKTSAIKTDTGTLSVPGACHGDDLEYIFTTTEGSLSNPVIEQGSEDDEVKQIVTKLWTDFAKTGVPNPDWPKGDLASNYSYLTIDTTLQTNAGFQEKEIKFWDNLYQFLKSS